MESGKIFGLRRLLVSSNITSAYWSIPQRGVSKLNVILKKMGLPEKPKKPQNAYLRFYKSARLQLAAQNPDMSILDISRHIGKQWLKIPDEEKQKYIKEYESEKTIYEAEINKFNQSMSDKEWEEVIVLLEEEELKKSQQLIQKKIKKQEKELKKPKGPGGVFAWYWHKYCTNVGLKEAAEKWKNLPESKKDSYKAERAEELKKRVDNLFKWEKEMVQQGKIDLVSLNSIRKMFHSMI